MFGGLLSVAMPPPPLKSLPDLARNHPSLQPRHPHLLPPHSNMSLQEQAEKYMTHDRCNIPHELLEAFVDEQVSAGTYHMKANLALLKIYQFSPQVRNIDYCAKILIKALSHPSDFVSYMYLLPENVQCAEPVSTLSSLSSLLEGCKFSRFWDEVKTQGPSIPVLKSFPNFSTDVQSHIAGVIASTYQDVPVAVVGESMRFGSDGERDAFFKTKGWTIEGENVLIPSNTENMDKVVQFKEKMSLPQLAPMLSQLTR
jgi:translation initiation factor 3 subunit K